MVGKLFILSLVVAVIVVNLVIADPELNRTSKFSQISLFVRSFVGLLLGFFLNSSIIRWYDCAKGFLELFDAVRSLQMELYALGVCQEYNFKICRYGVLSGFLLMQTMKIQYMPEGEQDEATEKMWRKLLGPIEPPPTGCPWKEEWIAMDKDEIRILKTSSDPAGMPWVWVSQLVGRMAEDGHVPPMATPTFGRLMRHVQDAHGGIRSVRSSIQVQAPFIYIHLMATLVHIHNLLSSVSFGFTIGTTYATLRAWYEPKLYPHSPSARDVVADLENLLIMSCMGVFGPLLYQALLDVGICLSQPFSNSEGEIPVRRLLKQLQTDIADAAQISQCPPSWEIPHFKKP